MGGNGNSYHGNVREWELGIATLEWDRMGIATRKWEGMGIKIQKPITAYLYTVVCRVPVKEEEDFRVGSEARCVGARSL